MKRINEALASKYYLNALKTGKYSMERSINTEVNYKEEKSNRDSKYVQEFLKNSIAQDFLNSK